MGTDRGSDVSGLGYIEFHLLNNDQILMTVSCQRLGTALSHVVPILAIALLASGCTSTGLVDTDYDAQQNRTAYESDAIGVPGMSWGSGYGSSKSLEVRAEAECQGRECRPDRVRLVFQVSGSGRVRMENRNVELVANGQKFGSARRTGDVRDTYDEAAAMGVIATMEMPFRDFRTIAEAEEVTGSVGTSGFTLSYSRRGPFQALVRQVTGEDEAGQSS